MDELDEQLRKLSLINIQLSANKGSPVDENSINVAKLVNNIEEKNNYAVEYQPLVKNRVFYGHEHNSAKKVGPSVPPKPHKKSPNVPEIPQSSLVRQACEPLYAQRLQSVVSNSFEDDISKLPSLLRKHNSFTDTDPVSNTLASKAHRKVTLDNPAILEQQLEALEYHKKQLEKRGKLSNNLSKKAKASLFQLNAPKLSSSSLFTDNSFTKPSFLENSNGTYENTGHANNTSNKTSVSDNSKSSIYGNIISSPITSLSNFYSNISYDKDKRADAYGDEKQITSEQTAISKKEATLSTNGNNTIYFTHNGSLMQEEEILSPPSPVSSSYSELRRATEVFKTNEESKKGATLPSNDHTTLTKPVVGYEMPLDHKLSVTSNDVRKMYMNKLPYTAVDGFNSYNPDEQTKTNPTLSDYYGYGGFSQTSSTYESIYEPINPRPPSQLSSRSPNLVYPAIGNNSNIASMPEVSDHLTRSNSSNLSTLSGQSENISVRSNSPVYPNSSRGSEGGGTLNRYPQNSKKLESLNQYLVKSIEPQQDFENYGICYKCNEIVVGENSGCTAMDQIYHISCFTCSQCQINLQGKPFYALDCKPFCEFDYLQTLEKCSVCVKPILERILRATGKPYHPQCFTCVVCKKSLDGIPFTVDATNQNYCIEDFHKKFAPRCCVCKDPIMPEPGEEETVRVVALDRSFHFECYKCEDCDLLLSSEAEGRGCYPLDDHVLCKSCNAKRVQMLTNRMTTTEL